MPIVFLSMQSQPSLSRTRQALVRLRDELGHLLEVFLARDALVKGSVYTLHRRCGKATCGCARGPRHGTLVLSWSERGRARLVKLHAQMVALIDALEAGRREAP